MSTFDMNNSTDVDLKFDDIERKTKENVIE